MPIISIVLPSYNGAKYIRQAIDSVINQTFVDWELILVDDCSTDSTAIIMDEYAKRDSRIRVIHNANNHQLPSSLNIGFELASGQYLTWTSDDNIYLPEALKKMLDNLSAHEDSPMVCADMSIINGNGEEIAIEKTGAFDLCIANEIGACFLYRRDVLQTIGEYDASMFLVEDYDYWLRIEECYGNIVHINEVLYRYRRHSGSLSETKLSQVQIAKFHLREKHCEYILTQLINDYVSLCKIFCENYLCGFGKCRMNQRIAELFKELNPLVMQTKEYTKVVIFGAGDYGKRCVKGKKEQVLFVVDNNSENVGNILEDKEVKSINDLEQIDKETCVIIAVSLEKKPQIIRQLYELGIRNIDIWI